MQTADYLNLWQQNEDKSKQKAKQIRNFLVDAKKESTKKTFTEQEQRWTDQFANSKNNVQIQKTEQENFKYDKTK